MSKKLVLGKNTTQKTPYLTKRILVSAAKSGVRRAARETMKVMGYTVIAQDGWIIKKYLNGNIERVSQLEPANANDLKLD